MIVSIKVTQKLQKLPNIQNLLKTLLPSIEWLCLKSHPKGAKLPNLQNLFKTLAQYRAIVSPKRTNVTQNGRLWSQCLRIGTCHHALSIFGRHMSTPLRRCHVDMLYLLGGCIRCSSSSKQYLPTYRCMWAIENVLIDVPKEMALSRRENTFKDR